MHWESVLTALRDINYNGSIVIESFTLTIKKIARAVSMWRPVAKSGDDLARDGVRFLKQQIK